MQQFWTIGTNNKRKPQKTLVRTMNWRKNIQKQNLTFSPPYLLSSNTVTNKRVLNSTLTIVLSLSLMHSHRRTHTRARHLHLSSNRKRNTDAVAFCMCTIQQFKSVKNSWEKCNWNADHFAFDLPASEFKFYDTNSGITLTNRQKSDIINSEWVCVVSLWQWMLDAYTQHTNADTHKQQVYS